MSAKANWNYPTAVKFGIGRIKELADHCRALGMHNPLLVTDAGLASLPMTQTVLADLQSAGLGAALFAAIRPNPVGANVEAGLAAYRGGGHDGVVAFGGGSGLDIGKLIALMSGQTRPIWDFEDIGDWWTRADPAGIAPIIAVPTTAGTGSEVGRAAVVTDESNHTKKIIFHPMAGAVARHVGARHVVITDVNPARLELAGQVADIVPVNVATEDLRAVMARLKLVQGFDVGMEMSGNAAGFEQMVDSMVMGGRIAMLGFPPGRTAVDWSKIVIKALTIKGVYGREIFETWYKMIAMLENGLDISRVITHRFPASDFETGFAAMRSGLSGKVVLDWA